MAAKITVTSHRKRQAATAKAQRERSAGAAKAPHERSAAAAPSLRKRPTAAAPSHERAAAAAPTTHERPTVSDGSSPKGSELPAHATLKDISATYNQDTIPRELRTSHTLPPDTWALVAVTEGEVNVQMDGRTIRARADAHTVVPPNTPFALAAAGKHTRFSLHYYHEPVLQDGKALETVLGRKIA